MSVRPITLQFAASWHCPKCGAKNYCDLEIVEFNMEEKQKYFEENNEELVTGEYLDTPDEITCGQCQTEFEVNDIEA